MRVETAFNYNANMNNKLNDTKISSIKGTFAAQFRIIDASFQCTHKAIPHKGVAFLFENKQSITILLMLIISSIKQRLTITLNNSFNTLSCSVLRWTTRTCIILNTGLIDGAYRGAI